MPPNPRGKKTATPTMDADGDEQLRRITVNLKARDIKRIDKLIEETGLSRRATSSERRSARTRSSSRSGARARRS